MTTTEVGPADRSKLLRSKQAECSAIVQSRKRKLRELFAIATEVDGIPNFDFTFPDAPPTTAAEAKFLADCDILQGRKFNELNLPRRRQPRTDGLERYLSAASASKENIPQPSKTVLELVVTPSTSTSISPPKEQTGPVSTLPSGSASRNASPPATDLTGERDLSSQKLANVLSSPPPPPPPNTRSLQPTTETTDDPTVASSLAKPAPPIVQTNIPEAIPRSPKPSLTLATTPAPEQVQVQGQDVAKGARDGQPVAEDVTEQMDIDEPASEPYKDQSARHLTLPTPNGDPARAPDALSSPASTIHTATTPAVHDASTDTSPDNEGPQYTEPDEETIEEARTPTGPKAGDHEEVSDRHQKTPAASENVPSPAQVDETGRMLNGVEAQLLEESAAASIGKTSQPTSAGSLIPVPPTIERTSPSPSGSLSKEATADKESLAQEELQSTNITTGEGDGEAPESMDVDVVRPRPSERAAQETQGPDLGVTANVPPSGPASAKAPTTEEAGQVPEVPAERAVTRTTSGAIKPRSVLELLGESSKPIPQVPGAEGPVSPADPATRREPEDSQETQSRAVSTVASKSAADRLRERRRKSIPTVVFGKSTKKPADETSLARRQAEGPSMKDDYFTPLFIEGFTRNTPWMKPIEQLLNQSHKTVTTPDQYIPVLEHQACRILRRVYQLQQGDKWSLRQPVRCPEPTRPASQWDVLIQEMKWMRTDFREERKWKRAVARNLANDCADWVASTPEERKLLQVNAVIPPIESRDTQMVDEALDGAEDPLPDLIHSDSPTNNEDESIEEQEVLQTVAPSAIFALPDDEVVFSLRPSNIADQLLEELPLYGSPLKVPKFDLTVPEFDPDSHWKRPAVPLSKYVEGKMVFKANGPPQKRSRYDYPDEDEDDGEVVFGQPAHSRVALPPVNANVALFNPEMQIVKDRLHAGHQFRPPVEYPMPLQSFYECRSGSQWTLAEDEELRALVREYSYNWSLISSIVQSKSLFHSGAERRTPWECFERWVALEGLPQDMGRTQYFRTYTNRIDTAQKIIAQQNQAAQQQVGPNGAVTPVPRKRATTTVRVERRRNQKHLALIDAMRKLAKKREGTVQRNQHQAALAANRKVPEPQRTAGPSKTPRDYSLMRWERDQQLAEKMAQYAARQADIQQQRRAQMARSQGQANQIPASGNNAAQSGPTPAQIAAAQSVASGARLGVPGQLAVPGQGRPRMAMPGTPNAVAAAHAQAQAQVQAQMAGGLVPPLQMNALSPTQMQALQAQQAIQQQAQHRMPMHPPQPDINVVIQAKRIQDQQRAFLQHQQQQQQQQHNQQQLNQQQQQQLNQQQAQQQQQQQQQAQQHAQQQQHLQQQAGQHTPQMQASNSVAQGVAQGSPSAMRNMVNSVGVNGVSQQHYLANMGNNAQAMLAAFNAANSGGMSSPGMGLSMPNMGASSPRPPQMNPQQTQLQLRELEAKYRNQFPNHAQDAIRTMAMEHLSRIIVQRQQHLNLNQSTTNLSQSAMNAAAGAVAQQVMANGMTPTTSPHQYAQLLRAQQQAQAASVAAQQAQQAAGQHQRQSSGSQLSQRQSSGSATPTGPVNTGNNPVNK